MHPVLDVGVHVGHRHVVVAHVGLSRPRLHAMHPLGGHHNPRFGRADFGRSHLRVLVRVGQCRRALLDQFWRVQLHAVARLVIDLLPNGLEQCGFFSIQLFGFDLDFGSGVFDAPGKLHAGFVLNLLLQ